MNQIIFFGYSLKYEKKIGWQINSDIKFHTFWNDFANWQQYKLSSNRGILVVYQYLLMHQIVLLSGVECYRMSLRYSVVQLYQQNVHYYHSILPLSSMIVSNLETGFHYLATISINDCEVISCGSDIIFLWLYWKR